MPNRHSLILSISLLAGCATPNIDKTYSLDANRGAGVAVGTLTYTGDYASYRLHIVGVESGQTYRIQHGDSQTLNIVLAFKGEAINPALGAKGSAFAIELPAGNYSVKQWQVSQGAANVWSTDPPGITFHIEPGKSIYLGNFHFTETGKSLRSITRATVALTEMSDRDLPVLQNIYPSLKSNPIVQSLAPQTKIENVGGKSEGKIAVPIFIPIAR